MFPAREPVHQPFETDSDSHSSGTTFAPTHITPEIFLGDKMPDDKPPNTTRMFFVNVNGLRFGPQGGEFLEVCAQMHSAHIDMLGLAETKLDTQKREVVATCTRAARRTFPFSRVVMSSSAISYTSHFKPGGTALIAAGSITGRIIATFQDPMGRWSAISLIGAGSRQLTVISAYQVCNTRSDRNTKARSMAAATQQQAMISISDPNSSMHPRTKFRIDILAFIQKRQRERHDIILMGDFNEAYGADPSGLMHIASTCALVDVFHQRIGSTQFATFSGGRARIDYVLMSHNPATAVRHCGYEPPGFRFQGDHRGFFLDFDTDKLFGNTTPILAPPASRNIVSSDRQNCARYVEAKYKYLKDHRWFQRLSSIGQDSPPNHQLAESLDRDWLRASLHAENKCTSRPAYPYSVALANLRQRKRALQTLITAFKRHRPMDQAFLTASARTSESLPTTLAGCEAEYRQLCKKLKQMEKDSVNLRKNEQQARLNLRLQQGDRAGAQAIRNILVAEETKEMWRQLRSLSPPHDSGITTVEVPSDGDLSTPNCKDCTSWTFLTDPLEIRQALICRNRLHFGQAHGTFPTIPPFSDAVDWIASTPAADEILEGTLPFADDDLDETTTLFLHQFRLSTALNSISSAVTEREWVGKMKVWRETTTTSPSGMHLGHHKALLKDFPISDEICPPGELTLESKRQLLLQGQLDLLNYAIRHSYTYSRWQKVATFMIRKDCNSSKIHRLRVIHLYEADLNLLLGVKWRALIHHCIDNAMLNPGQFGGLPGRDAMTPIFLEELQWETTRASRRSLLRMDFDASSCYDRIIPSIASLAARSFGQHQALCFIHATFLRQAKYFLKTKLGLSDEEFSHRTLHPIYGTGQGSANSPVIWVLISSRLFDAHAARAYGATFFSPDRSLQLQMFMIGFVDDSNACVNDFANPNQSPTVLLQRATADAQLWNDLLCCSGGALEIPKCAYHLAHYDFSAAGAPVLKTLPLQQDAVKIREPSKLDPTSLKYLSPYVARKTLGCSKSPSTNFKASLQHIASIAKGKSEAVLKNFISAESAHRYYYSVFLPSVTYSFPTNTIPERHLRKVQNESIRPILNRMGYARSIPHAIVYGPQFLGGIGLRSFYDEQGSSKMELVLKHFRSSTMVTTQLHIALAWCQRMSGISKPILEFPSITLPHLETSFFPSLRAYLSSTNSALVLEKSHVTPLQRIGDFHLMDRVLEYGQFRPREIRLINYCRLYLQVHTIADLTTAEGTLVDPGFLYDQVSLLSSRSTDLEIIQERPSTPEAWTAWRKACSLWCNIDTGALYQPLGPWKFPSVSLRRSWPYHWDPPTGRLWIRTPDGYSSHRPFSRGPRGLRFHRHSNNISTILPDSCFPTAALEFRIGFTRLPGQALVQPLPTISSPSFEHFISIQPTWINKLLHTLHHINSFTEIFDLLSGPSSSPIAVCDGSVLSSQGTFGWVLATSTPQRILLQCNGPAYGSNMDSYRAEAYGLLSITTFIHLLETYFKRSLQSTTIWCDNLSVVKTVNRLISTSRPEFPNETLRPSWDILQAIRKNFKLHPHLTLLHVKGHQDDLSDQNDLPFPAQLNVQADLLATEFQQATAHVTDQGPMIPGTGCHLLIENQFIPSYHRRKIRTKRGQRKLLRYIQERHQLSEADVSHIDWDSHARAINTLQHKSNTFIVKFLSRKLPVGKQVHRYNPAAYPSTCPSCECPIEDFVHVFRCPYRRKWQSTLRHELLQLFNRSNTNPVLADLLINGLHHWLRETPDPPASPFPQYDSLVAAQSSIGWSQLLFGRWSTLWIDHQHRYLKQHNIPLSPQNHGTGWSSRIIHLIWTHCYDEWIVRNQALHGHNDQTRQLARLHQAQYRIRAMYELRNKCSQYVRDKWFYSSPEEHFQHARTPCHLENWLAVNEAQILAHITHHQKHRRTGQRDITDFFPPINLHNAANFPPPPSDTPRSDSLTNAPLTSEPGGFADDGLRARR